ncbi:hypothetical protein F5Y00DRAFT_264419 [Daldinia vernicosa]|uniref:uncharacterized protein n=1 Tax=Daldinia vernicosa TaxID=114800 RepID=UPI00200725CE|nr:uncharacterized protein F5Y00DRAFT_264419 [Daldinia vernicosa]KAI0846606.1 hypothetical protein F5Y00DRAFT_264419 [Daldinia vernicosa]
MDGNGYFNDETVVFTVFGVITLVVAFLALLLRFFLQSFTQRYLAYLDSFCVGLAWLLSLIGIICAVAENTTNHLEYPPEIDKFVQSLFALSAILGKLSICLSVWPLVKDVKYVSVVVVFQIAMLFTVYPLWIMVIPATCGASAWYPMLAPYAQCSDIIIRAIFDWLLSFFEVFTPIILTGFPIEMAQDTNTEASMRKPFVGLSIASAIMGAFMWSRAWMSHWFRYDTHFVPLIGITTIAQNYHQLLNPQDLNPQDLNPQDLNPQDLNPQDLNPQDLNPQDPNVGICQQHVMAWSGFLWRLCQEHTRTKRKKAAIFAPPYKEKRWIGCDKL